MFVKPTDNKLAEMPALYAQENEKDPVIRLRFFCGEGTNWWVTEVRPD